MDHLVKDEDQQLQEEEKALAPLIDAISRKWAVGLAELDLSANRVGMTTLRRLAEQCFKAVALEKIDISHNEPEHDMEHEDVEEFRRGARMHSIEIKADFKPKPDFEGARKQAQIDLARFKQSHGGVFSIEGEPADAEGGLPDSLIQAQEAASAQAEVGLPLIESKSEPVRLKAPPPNPSSETEQGGMMAPAAES